MSKLIIDERDLRCTILEGVGQLLGLSPELAPNSIEAAAIPIINAVTACGDKPAASVSETLDRIERSIGVMLTTPMRAPARAQYLVEILTLVNSLRVDPGADMCPICEFGQESERTLAAVRYSCGHWLKRKPEEKTE